MNYKTGRLFEQKKPAQHSVHPTGGESARFRAVYLASSWFRQSGVVSSRLPAQAGPPAGNASRWLASSKEFRRDLSRRHSNPAMKSNTCLVNGLIVGFLALLMGGIGFSIGNSATGEYNPPWKRYAIQAAPKETVKIAHVEINSTLFDPAGDIVFVADKEGDVFSNTVFQSEWSVVDPVPTWDNNHISNCTAEKLGPTESHMWDTPPVEKDVIDSAGIIFERPVSTIVRCYVLLDDGSLEVWVHSGNAMDSMAGGFLKNHVCNDWSINWYCYWRYYHSLQKTSSESSNMKASQHSVHPTGGTRRVFRQVSWLEPVPSKRFDLVPPTRG